MSDYEKLTRKAESLNEAARKCKTSEGRDVCTRMASTIIAVRDSMTVEEAGA